MKIHFHITYPIQYGQQKYQIFFVSLPSTASQDQNIFRPTKKHLLLKHERELCGFYHDEFYIVIKAISIIPAHNKLLTTSASLASRKVQKPRAPEMYYSTSHVFCQASVKSLKLWISYLFIISWRPVNSVKAT